VSALPRAHELGLIGCHVCGLVCRDAPVPDAACPRCGSPLHRRKTASYARTWALLVAAFILYIPANVLPIMRTASLGDVDDNTIPAAWWSCG
jgi:paraquat-inducible protein A